MKDFNKTVSDNKSLKFSKICVWLFFILATVFCIFVPWIYDFFAHSGFISHKACVPLPVITYLAAIPAYIMLISLGKLLYNIGRAEVFCSKNVKYLSVISWCCIATGVIAFVGGIYLYYFWLILIAVLAAFVGLILRVVKNVMALAYEIKQENDFTI